jgi:uncharacterized protein (TIGR03083 family)
VASDANELFHALEAAIVRLRNLAENLDDEQLTTPAYPSEWTVADVLSHLGAGTEMTRVRIEASVTGRELEANFTTAVWDTWNAKSPGAKAADALAADRALVDRIDSLTSDERAAVQVAFGPVELDLAGVIGARLNEHVLHTWDIDVVLDPSATIPSDAAASVVDNLDLIVGFAGKPTGASRAIHVRTTDPARDFTLTLGADAVTLAPRADDHDPDLELPAEAFIRLVYGRLDPEHTPPSLSTVELDELRRAFPGL